nr:hypothetical protein [Tanacetum cinerariifolium]
MATVTLKKVNDVVQLHALINEKKVVVTEDVIRSNLRLDDADRVECLPTEEIFVELARMGYEKPPPNAKRTAWNEFSYSMASAVICLATDAKEENEVEVPNAPTSPSPTNAPSPPLQDPTPTPHALPPSPLQDQPTNTSASFMTLLNSLLETYATLSQKVDELEQGKHTQALVIIKLKNRVKKLEKKKKLKSSGLKRLKKVGTSQRVESSADTVVDAELQGRIDDDNAVTKDVNAVEPTVFYDEEEVEKATAMEKQEKDDLERAQVLQQQKPVSIAQARKNMITYLKNMAGYKMEHFRVSEFKVKALQVKHPIIDWEIHTEGSRTYWKIIRVGRIIEAYQSFEDMLKGFDREDLVALWSLVKEKFSTPVLSVDKEKALWLELKRLFKPDVDDVLWKLQRLMLLGKDDTTAEVMKKSL